MKKVAFKQTNNRGHWVGDGFPVRSIFSYNDRARELSPFLLLDYAGPTTFHPTNKRLGVGEHPHRGFETVTIVYSGEVEHRDSSGGGGIIGAGDVQWMTAAGGLVHEEFHGPEFAKRGGVFEVIQLWVNLPAKDKMAQPGYQALTSDGIPVVDLVDGAGFARIIAGRYGEVAGPARTFTPMDVWDVRLNAGAQVELPASEGHTTAVFVLKGRVRVGTEEIGEGQLVALTRDGANVGVEAIDSATLLFLSGEPIYDPIVGYGPFVMNTEDEIRQAVVDYQTGKMGHLKERESV
jgi:redox-sensitive bicupin YhaK (pirin superfamily)